MPSGNRIRANNNYGLTTDDPLTSGATTFNSTGLSNLPTVASAHAIVTLDPLRQFGAPEIIVVTAHTSSATVATVTRAQYGTAARSHPVNTTWVHAPLDEDLIEVLTAATRPSNPYEGQFIFETDTNKLVGYGGVDWAPRDAGGQLGYAQVVANQGSITVDTNLTGLAVTVTVGTGRRIRLAGECMSRNSGAGNINALQIKETATLLQYRQLVTSTAAADYSHYASVVITPTAGSHTYKLTLVPNAGTAQMSAAATFPAFILVEDIGAA